ncbi:uncharacterized protein K452DRAFT_246902 [Aplosporella prunicola CBS 121167]|uniref:VPS9 domain-containing protein n=1 Tax=Aplosporella prunicola CBS 121167 TaxID=1176127 RepID=A0A6A6BJR9_9PEZI|nr:uncharacterized protein K452DRAFT_246902 [Aplosporella prunicola CBS 121167]KAF2143633.1 hypothetical protein K452DRAFT_246902 [Aplosporella prunicola CBS 121167]
MSPSEPPHESSPGPPVSPHRDSDGDAVHPDPRAAAAMPMSPAPAADPASSAESAPPAAQLESLSLAELSSKERAPSPPPTPPAKDNAFPPAGSNADTRSHPSAVSPQQRDPAIAPQDADAVDFDEKGDYSGAAGTPNAEDDSRTEIQTIMDQFSEGVEGPGMDEIMSPRLEKATPTVSSSTSHPPRKSSLAIIEGDFSVPESSSSAQSEAPQAPPPRTSSLHARTLSTATAKEKAPAPGPVSPLPPSSLYKPPPPEPDPEPDLPFDFHRFLEQLRHRTADPVAKFLRSFLLEFGKKQWMVHEQVKIISDFLEFISKKMAQCDIWRTVSDAEFDNAREGMEKLVMNRLYTQTFSPAIPPPEPMLGRNRRRPGQHPMGPGRRGQHQEDVERDEVLAQKVRIYSWVREEHLDIKPVNVKGMKFLKLAQQELLKIRNYRAPRDKVICILNCCKVIFGFLRNAQSDQSADSFIPLLIFTVLRANPDHLVSNVQYILRFRNQEKLGGEAGYYISSLMGAIQFIENLDRTSLTISDEEFEKNVEAAVSAIAERNSLDEPRQQQPSRHPSPHMHVSEKSAISRPEVTPRNSLDAERATPRASSSGRTGVSSSSGSADGEEENAAVAGLLRTIQRPLSTIGRIFSDDGMSEKPQSQQPISTPQPGSTPRLSPMPRGSSEEARRASERRSFERQRQMMSAEDAAARQASAEAEEARKIQRQEHQVVVETLAGMFPDLDRDVIDDVVRLKEGRVGLAVDACLALSN